MSFNPNWRKRPELPTFIPPLEAGGAPGKIRSTRHIDDVLYVAGDGPTPCDVMFITPGVQPDDVRETVEGTYGHTFKQPAAQLKNPAGQIFRRLVRGAGIESFFVTSICKWLLPKTRISKPKASDIAWGWPALKQEIEEVKPRIIVCLGKPVFDQFCEFKFKLSEIEGGWFRSHEFGCLLYPMDDMQNLVRYAEYVVKWDADLHEIKRMIDSLRGVAVAKVATNYRIISTAAELTGLVAELLENRVTRAAVDCEWGGLNHIDGRLRSLQMSWAPGEAVYIRFRDEKGEYVFDVDYKAAGNILRPLCEQPDWLYYGHQLVADFAWIHHVLGLEVYRRGGFDTLYAQQVLDENADVKLERMALKYTDLGRYDIDLLMWKKMNSLDEDEGYERVPDSILIPYALHDVDATMRMQPILCRELALQGAGLLSYYYGLFLPFVTDVFTCFTLTGLPMDMRRLSLLREIFLLVRSRLEVHLQEGVTREARVLLMRKMAAVAGGSGVQAWQTAMSLFDAQKPQEAVDCLKTALGPTLIGDVMPFIDHLLDAPAFNIRSQPQMRRWLYQVKGFTPLKTTNNKDKGMPSISWEKVLEFPAERQREFVPSCDKQTLTVLAVKDDLVHELLTLNEVGNLVKAFLRPAELDAQGDILRERGLHFWVASDQRVHCQFSATETGRPRAWKPNVLNWPSEVLKSINGVVGKLVKKEQELPELERPLTGLVLQLCGRIPEDFSTQLPSLRSCVNAASIPALPGSAGWCVVESDYQTAEVRGLAFISGDPQLIDLITKPDTQFGVVKGYKLDDSDGWVRLAYAKNCGIPEAAQDARFLLAQVKEGKVLRQWTRDDLQREPDGSLVHPRFDKHWALAEMTYERPRETMRKKIERGAGKVGNFQTMYGCSPASLERKIESDTGSKPEEGTGQKILDALAQQQAVAEAWLKSMEAMPAQGTYTAASGRIRHFAVPDERVPYRERERILSGLAREARNFPIQHSVANVATRAAILLLDYYRTHGMVARPMVLLYDSIVTLCPVEERWKVAELHERFMFKETFEVYHGRELHYPIDTEFNLAWSEKAPKEWKAKLDDPAWPPAAVVAA